MHKWIFRSLLVCGIFIVVWFVAAMVWSARGYTPAFTEVLLYLVALPVAIIGAVVLAANALRPAADSSGSPGAAEDAMSNENETASPERGWTIALLANAVRTAHGKSAQELSQALVSNTAKPVLDSKFTDADGYPVLTSRVQELDEEEQRELLAEWQGKQNISPINWSPEQLRAMSMATAIAAELGQTVALHPLLDEYKSAPASTRPAIALPVLQMVAVLPSGWEQEQRQAASQWLLHVLGEHGWPPEKIALSAESSRTTSEPFGLIDRLLVSANREGGPFLTVLIACESCVGEKTVAEWASTGRLFTAKNEAGQIPGEGAAGLLLADAGQAALMNTDTTAFMHRVAQGRRDKAVDASGRTSSDLLIRLVGDALAIARAHGEQIKLVAADTDHRLKRKSELMEAANDTFPELDLQTQCFGTAAACGEAGAVSSLTALALAHHEAATNGNSAVCISNSDAYARAAVVVSPKPVDAIAERLAA